MFSGGGGPGVFLSQNIDSWVTVTFIKVDQSFIPSYVYAFWSKTETEVKLRCVSIFCPPLYYLLIAVLFVKSTIIHRT